MMRIPLLTLGLMLGGSQVLAASVTVYPVPPNVHPGDKFIAPSDQYKVEVIQNGRTQESFVYLMHAQHYSN
ncbi:MAG: hypothetical protein QG602_4171 [Verrucomicrobiota bacterium]|nr:hypothetical protein [Verrucomicrobiota bacterium]